MISSLQSTYYYSSDYGTTITTCNKASQTFASTDSPWQAAVVNA